MHHSHCKTGINNLCNPILNSANEEDYVQPHKYCKRHNYCRGTDPYNQMQRLSPKNHFSFKHTTRWSFLSSLKNFFKNVGTKINNLFN